MMRESYSLCVSITKIRCIPMLLWSYLVSSIYRQTNMVLYETNILSTIYSVVQFIHMTHDHVCRYSMTVVRMYGRGICKGFSVKEAYGAPCMWGGGEEGGKTSFEDHMIAKKIPVGASFSFWVRM